jgi:hypothetical protein
MWLKAFVVDLASAFDLLVGGQDSCLVGDDFHSTPYADSGLNFVEERRAFGCKRLRQLEQLA